MFVPATPQVFVPVTPQAFVPATPQVFLLSATSSSVSDPITDLFYDRLTLLDHDADAPSPPIPQSLFERTRRAGTIRREQLPRRARILRE